MVPITHVLKEGKTPGNSVRTGAAGHWFQPPGALDVERTAQLQVSHVAISVRTCCASELLQVGGNRTQNSILHMA